MQISIRIQIESDVFSETIQLGGTPKNESDSDFVRRFLDLDVPLIGVLGKLTS